MQSMASTFAAWKVVNLPFGDTLNVRKYPASTSQKQAAYPNGTVLQMTGKCTGGVNLLDIAGQPAWKQIKAVRYRLVPGLARSGAERTTSSPAGSTGATSRRSKGWRMAGAL